MELSRKLCWVVKDPSETQRGSDKGSHMIVKSLQRYGCVQESVVGNEMY